MLSVSPAAPFLIARSILSLGMLSARALATARRRRALADGSGSPCLAARVMSRDSLENSLERSLSCLPLRNWMFLNFECPAMAPRVVEARPPRGAGARSCFRLALLALHRAKG